ncbi:MAG: hypothetical protein IT538_12210 [Variibacter sp.]|nr:hypothetical protein [Variibacter sp.]
MLKTSLALAFLLAVSSTSVMAQTQNRSGTQREHEACTRDVTRHCRKLMGEGDFVILRCLQEHRAKLSTACRKVLESHNQ